ncbi:MAG: AI-2E family transporter [Streptosporangiales bacterium]|nr:AI-2E family transporter [Streptosporangiales bacterium]MBO0890611.1 AI-2E family transporter [Acidothermales bacterium]
MGLIRRRDPRVIVVREQGNATEPEPTVSDRAPWALRVISDWSWRILVVAAFVALLLWLISQIKLVAVAFIIGVLLTALLQPFVGGLNRMKVPRLLSTAIVFIVGLAVLAGLGAFVGTQVSSNAGALGAQFTDILNTAENWLTKGPLHVNVSQLNNVTGTVSKALNDNWQRIATGAVTGLGTTVEIVGGVVLAAFCTFFLLLDGGEIWHWLRTKFPERSRARVGEGGEVAWRTLSHYVRGTVLIAFLDAVAVTVTLLVAGVPLAVPVGVLVFLGAFIPVLGLAVTGALAVGLALVSKGPIIAVIVLGVIVLAVQVEGHVLQPLVMSRAVRVHPLAVLLSVTAGSLVAGIFGAVIAVPLVAVVNNVLTARIIDFHMPTRPRERIRRNRAVGDAQP